MYDAMASYHVSVGFEEGHQLGAYTELPESSIPSLMTALTVIKCLIVHLLQVLVCDDGAEARPNDTRSRPYPSVSNRGTSYSGKLIWIVEQTSSHLKEST